MDQFTNTFLYSQIGREFSGSSFFVLRSSFIVLQDQAPTALEETPIHPKIKPQRPLGLAQLFFKIKSRSPWRSIHQSSFIRSSVLQEPSPKSPLKFIHRSSFIVHRSSFIHPLQDQAPTALEATFIHPPRSSPDGPWNQYIHPSRIKLKAPWSSSIVHHSSFYIHHQTSEDHHCSSQESKRQTAPSDQHKQINITVHPRIKPNGPLDQQPINKPISYKDRIRGTNRDCNPKFIK